MRPLSVSSPLLTKQGCGGGRLWVYWNQDFEALRKDEECTYGILKSRFRLLRDLSDIEAAFKICCILHNMILVYDGRTLNDWENNVDWKQIDPDLANAKLDVAESNLRPTEGILSQIVRVNYLTLLKMRTTSMKFVQFGVNHCHIIRDHLITSFARCGMKE